MGVCFDSSYEEGCEILFQGMGGSARRNKIEWTRDRHVDAAIAGGHFWNMHRRPVVQTVGIPRPATHASNVRDGLDAKGCFGKVDFGGWERAWGAL